MNEKISVIIPIYNAEKYLKATLDCIRFQTYTNLEIICVLDCPTDNSENIINEIAKNDERIIIVKNSENTGPGETRNRGMHQATGEYLHFMDSDDFLNPDFYELMINSAIKTNADVSASSVFYEQKPKQSIWIVQDEVISGKEKMNRSEVLFHGWIWRYLIKKSFWTEYKFSFPDLSLMEDSTLAISIIYYANKLVLCSNAMYFYKNRENSVLNKTESNAEQEKQRKNDVRKAAKGIKDFIRLHKIKRSSWLYRHYISFRTKRTVCINDPVEYGKFDKKISVIVPIYNVEKFLKQSINSIRFQTYKNLEIICVPDCPTDSSAEIIKEIAAEDNRIKIIEHQTNKGLSATRHSGVENATGEYIHFMDSDDFLTPDFYEIMIDAAIKSNSDVAACSVFYEKKPQKSIWFQKSEVLAETIDKIKKTEVAIRGWAWRYLIRKSFWTERKFSFPDLVPMEDMPVMIPMIYYADKVVLCPGAVYFYKNRENSILNKKYDPIKEKQRKENRQKARKIFKSFMRENNIKRPNKLCYDIKKYIY